MGGERGYKMSITRNELEIIAKGFYASRSNIHTLVDGAKLGVPESRLMIKGWTKARDHVADNLAGLNSRFDRAKFNKYTETGGINENYHLLGRLKIIFL